MCRRVSSRDETAGRAGIGASGARRAFRGTVRDAIAIAAASVVLALATNAVRDDGLPLVAAEEYQILVPCPEPVGDVEAIAAASLSTGGEGALVVDARGAQAFAAWHLAGAWSVPFDFLDPTPDEPVARVARSGARRVVVYGDGAAPDSGRELARELAGRGIRNVFYVEGGAFALRQALGEGGAP